MIDDIDYEIINCMIDTTNFSASETKKQTIDIKMPDGSTIKLLPKKAKQSDTIRVKILAEKISNLMPAFQLETDRQTAEAIAKLGDDPSDEDIDKAYQNVQEIMKPRLEETIAPLQKIISLVVEDAQGGDGINKLVEWLLSLSSPKYAVNFINELTKELKK